MRNFLRYDGPLGRFLNSVADMVLLNLLWLLCSLPVVTIGASTVALYTVNLRYPEDDSGLAKLFFLAFRNNWKQGMAAGLLFLAAAASLILDFKIVQGLSDGWQVLKTILWAAVFVCLMMYVYTFPLLARYDQTLGKTLRNALLLGLSNLPATLLVMLLHALPVVAVVLNPEMFVSFALPFLTFLGPGILSFLSAQVMKRVYARYPAGEKG